MRVTSISLRVGLVLGSIALAATAHAQDAAKGKAVFARCGMCHGTDGTPHMGPDLKTVYGRKAGTLAGYNYSPAMKGEAVAWDDKALDSFVTAPRTMVPGTKMAFPGVSNPADRSNLIAYLKSLKSAK